MHVHSLRKLPALFLIYVVIIVGIFVLQFRNESLISRNSGVLHVTMTETSDKNQHRMLKNMLTVSFRGIRFSTSEETPLVVSESSGNRKEYLTLLSWDQTSPLSFEFTFTKNVTLTFTVSNDSADADLYIAAKLPDDIESLSLSYKPSGSFTVTDLKNKRAVFDSRNKTYQLAAPQITADRIFLTRTNNRAFYTVYNKTETFSLDSITDFTAASRTAYDQTVKRYRESVISSFFAEESSLDEAGVVAYVAEMASRGNYDQALDNVPDSFKRGTKRTYLSSPFFGSLPAMDQTLEMQRDQYATMIDYSLNSKSCDIFTIYSLPDYLIQNASAENIQKLVTLPASLSDFAPSVIQASGIVHVYTKLHSRTPELASALKPVLKQCINSILAAITVQENSAQITANGMNFTVLQAIQTGEALIEYGMLIQNEQIIDCGYLIVNSYLDKTVSLDERTQGEIYPVIVNDNTYYPHYLLLTDGVWAWTCAQSISYTEDTAHNITLDIEFPQGLTHYLIISGIPDFNLIEIYGLNFHTDPRFETYNSSGYVHLSENNTLLLKSRHKKNHEIIRIFYSSQPDGDSMENAEE